MPHTLDGWVTEQAQKRHNATALAMNDSAMSYAALDLLSNQLARTLIELGCHRGDRVCVLMPKSPIAIVTIIGIYKAGCIYVPLDPLSPATRLTKIIRSCDTPWILTAGIGSVRNLWQSGLQDLTLVIGSLDSQNSRTSDGHAAFSLNDVLAMSSASLIRRANDYDIAHILFTSGSTGSPKGVMITHANVIHFVEWATRYFSITADDRLSGHPPLYFDLSIFDIFGTFASGATLHLFPDELNYDANGLVEWVRANNITQWFSVPSVLSYVARFDALYSNACPSLKRVLWCGEVLPTPTLRYWMQHLPHARFTNLYGPTETTIASSFYTVPECPINDRVAIPIGGPCTGEELLVMDEQLHPVPKGEHGELYIRGVGLSPGYWRDPDQTRQFFLNHSESPDRIYRTGDIVRAGDDDKLYFIGRVDSQIKSRGYRIEMGEVEAALRSLPMLGESVVLAMPTGGFDSVAIACAYSAKSGYAVTPATLRSELEKLLPRYMIPSIWQAFSELPKNANGKTDRIGLRKVMLQQRPHYELS